MKYVGKKNKLVGYTKFDLGESEIDGRITIGEYFILWFSMISEMSNK